MRRGPLSPNQLFPAGRTDIHVRTVTLATGVRVRVAESGPANGPPVLLLHGWGASLYMYRHAFERLSSKGMRAVAVDLRGYGLSDKPGNEGAYSLDAYCADLDALLSALELRTAALIGQSMGGALGLRFALTQPEHVTKLVLINPAGLVRVLARAPLRFVPRSLAAMLGRRAVPRWSVEFILRYVVYGDSRKVDASDVDEYWSPTQLPGSVYASRAGLSEFDWRPVTDAEAASLAVPTVVILGTADRLIRNTAEAARRLRGSTLYRVAGGHCVHEENPAEVYAIISRFLAAGS